MRINVYAEEITNRVESVEAIAENTGSRFVGVRFYLESSDKMYPPKHPDDDSSAVTFWVKSGKTGFVKGQEQALIKVLQSAIEVLKKL